MPGCATWTGSARKRAQVRELSAGQIGYLHVPDMVSQGWADFHRDLRTEMLRDALIVDVRGNTGGEVSELVVEKLARKVIAWDVPSGLIPATYPEDAPRGPVVALADECAGSDGDIVTAAIRLLRLGPVVGARTWGGVIGFDHEHELIDGTQITVPRLAMWIEDTAGTWKTTASTPTSRSSSRPTTGPQGGTPSWKPRSSSPWKPCSSDPRRDPRPTHQAVQAPAAAAAASLDRSSGRIHLFKSHTSGSSD